MIVRAALLLVLGSVSGAVPRPRAAPPVRLRAGSPLAAPALPEASASGRTRVRLLGTASPEALAAGLTPLVPAVAAPEPGPERGPAAPRADDEERGAASPGPAPAPEPVPVVSFDGAAPREMSREERVVYRRVLAENVRWYLTTNVANKWRSHRLALAKAREDGTVAVPDQRGFFAAMRTTGMTGRYYVLGGSSLEDPEMAKDMRRAFRRWFRFGDPAAASEARAAFDRFVERARAYNVRGRSHVFFHKTVRDSMLAASLLPPDAVAARFDGLLREDRSREIAAFQSSGAMEKARRRFEDVLLEELAREDQEDPGRVVAVSVLGSFASGSAGPTSDFDAEVITADGGKRRLKPFSDRVVARWTELGLQRVHPVVFHSHATPPSRALIDRVYTEPYFVVTPDESLRGRLARAPGERPALVIERRRTLSGSLHRVLQGLYVRAVVEAVEWKARLGR